MVCSSGNTYFSRTFVFFTPKQITAALAGLGRAEALQVCGKIGLEHGALGFAVGTCAQSSAGLEGTRPAEASVGGGEGHRAWWHRGRLEEEAPTAASLSSAFTTECPGKPICWFTLKLQNCPFKVSSGSCLWNGSRIFLWGKGHLKRQALQWISRKCQVKAHISEQRHGRERN